MVQQNLTSIGTKMVKKRKFGTKKNILYQKNKKIFSTKKILKNYFYFLNKSLMNVSYAHSLSPFGAFYNQPYVEGVHTLSRTRTWDVRACAHS